MKKDGTSSVSQLKKNRITESVKNNTYPASKIITIYIEKVNSSLTLYAKQKSKDRIVININIQIKGNEQIETNDRFKQFTSSRYLFNEFSK